MLVTKFTESESSAIAKIILGSSGALKVFYREAKGGGVYLAESTNGESLKGLYLDFVGASSKGKFYNANVKLNGNVTVTRQ